MTENWGLTIHQLSEERSDGFEGTSPLCSMQRTHAPLCSDEELPGEHVSSLDPRFLVCPQNQGLLPTAALVYYPPAYPSLERRDTWQAEHWITRQSLSETGCRCCWVCPGCHENTLELSKQAPFPKFAIRVTIHRRGFHEKVVVQNCNKDKEKGPFFRTQQYFPVTSEDLAGAKWCKPLFFLHLPQSTILQKAGI